MMTPDALPLTGVPTLDAIVKLVGALAIICSTLAAMLPKAWKFTKVMAMMSADVRGIIPEAAAVKEAAAQAVGETTVKLPPPPAVPGGVS